MKFAASALLVVLVSAGSPAQEEKPEGDLARLQGTWKAEALGPEKDLVVTLTFKGRDVLYVARKGDDGERRKVEGRVELDESADPKWITFVASSQQLPDNLGIYKFEGDRLILRSSTQERPTRFEDGAEDQTAFDRQEEEPDT